MIQKGLFCQDWQLVFRIMTKTWQKTLPKRVGNFFGKWWVLSIFATLGTMWQPWVQSTVQRTHNTHIENALCVAHRAQKNSWCLTQFPPEGDANDNQWHITCHWLFICHLIGNIRYLYIVIVTVDRAKWRTRSCSSCSRYRWDF